MIEGFWLWLAFALLSATTFLTRGSFIMAGEKGRLPPALQRALRYAPAAALAALVAPDLLLVQGQLQPFNPKLLAGLAVIAVALRTRKPWLPFVLGMAVFSPGPPHLAAVPPPEARTEPGIPSPGCSSHCEKSMLRPSRRGGVPVFRRPWGSCSSLSRDDRLTAGGSPARPAA